MFHSKVTYNKLHTVQNITDFNNLILPNTTLHSSNTMASPCLKILDKKKKSPIMLRPGRRIPNSRPEQLKPLKKQITWRESYLSLANVCLTDPAVGPLADIIIPAAIRGEVSTVFAPSQSVSIPVIWLLWSPVPMNKHRCGPPETRL